MNSQEDEEIVVPREVEMVPVSVSKTHDWVQRGSNLECLSCPVPHGTLNAVPHGMMLVKEGGAFNIVPITPIA